MSAGILYAQDDVTSAEAMSSRYIPCDAATSEVMQQNQCSSAANQRARQWPYTLFPGY